MLGDPAAGRCRVRGAHGTGLGSVSETLRSGLSRRVHGRAAGAVGPGNPPADGGHEEPSPACRLRVRTGRHGRSLPVQRAAGGLAAGDGPGPACEGGLGAGGRRPVGRTLRRLPEDHLGVRPPQHAHQGSLLRSVRAGPGTGVGSSHRVLPHAETRELAEHRGERTELDDAPMRARAPLRRPRDAARRSVGVVHRRQWHATRCRLADEGRRCAL